MAGLILFLSLSIFSYGKADESAIVFDSANAAYAKGNYQKAIELYETILAKNTESSELYFNLGNAYFKTNTIGLAILNYERAKKLNPYDEDIITNLKLANQRTEDKIDEAPQLFLKEWKNGIIDILTEKAWSITCIILVCISLLMIALYILSGNQAIKKAGFFGGATLFIIAMAVFFMARNKYNLTKNSSDAIITLPSVTVTGSPNEKGTKLFILHEGTKVSVLKEESEWIEVKIANGNVGWVKISSLQKI